MAHHPHRWIYQEGTLVDKLIEGPEMVPVAPGIGLRTSVEEDPSEPMSDSEMMPEPEGMAPADAEGTGTFTTELREEISWVDALCYTALDWLRQFIAQFLSTARDSVDRARVELESRPGCSGSQCPQTENMSGSQSPNHANEAVSESFQNRQSEPIREATSRPEQATHKVIENFMIKMTELLETSMATRRNELVPATGANEALERFLKFRPSKFYGEVEQEIKAELFLEQLNDIYDTLKYEDALRVKINGLTATCIGSLATNGIRGRSEAATKTKMADQAVTQKKIAIGSAATPYKRPRQGPWKPRDFKRSRGEQRTGNEGQPTLTLGEAHRVLHTVDKVDMWLKCGMLETSTLRCNMYLRRRLEGQAGPRL
ncbi:hypothetical protein M9H77_36016 [Catharanthus roseus]|uniref:Uncharacterized protein n=1 Tax=Catharanthus roseus TaxID=4058 RepID=A0ACB9ZRY0_CATRO|nr:hypothetical protein M9H77_36016 [Catharanthus roseus]